MEEIELPKGRLKNKNKNKIHWREKVKKGKTKVYLTVIAGVTG